MSNEGQKWEGYEITAALDMYFLGRGMKFIAAMLGRGVGATTNLIRSDIPRNYRNCISWIPPKKGERQQPRYIKGEDIPFGVTEAKYLQILVNKGRTEEEICLVLARTPEAVRKEIARVTPQVERQGFFKKEKP